LERNKYYNHRADLENKIASILHRQKATKEYFVVYGPKGVGKSVLVDKCVDGKKGVVKVTISSVFQKSDILKVLSTELLGEAKGPLLSLKRR
jgi:AAA+ ATPase superfamily predicted ATPase